MSTPTIGDTAKLSARKRARISETTDGFPPKRPGSSDRSLAISSATTPSPSSALVSACSARTPSACVSCPVLQSELSALRAEMDHANSLRLLERRRFDQAEARLKRQIQFLTEEADEARRLMDEIRERTEDDLKRMAAARREALERVRDAEEKLIASGRGGALVSGGGSEEEEETALEQERRKKAVLEERLGAMRVEVDGLREALEGAERRAAEAERRSAHSEVEAEEGGWDNSEEGDEFNAIGGRESGDAAAAGSGASDPDGTPKRPRKPRGTKTSPLSPAPPAVMSELNRVRVQLAESERKGRQLARKLELTQRIADEAVRHREAARAAESRAERLEDEVGILRREGEKARAAEGQWADLRNEIRESFGIASAGDVIIKDLGDSGGGDAPPEIATVLRHFRSLKERVGQLEEAGASARTQLEASRRRVATLERQLKDANASVDSWQSEKKDLNTRAKAADSELRKIKAQEKIWQREADGLRSLLETYEKTQEERWKRAGKAGTVTGTGIFVGGAALYKPQDEGGGPTVQGLQLGLTSARDQIRVLEDEAATLREEAESAQKETKKLRAEHERVLEKFGKLRDALYKEREMAEKAEEKACRAEMLVGKGHFNDETTRALHLKDNPMMTAVREKFQKEIDALKRALKEREEELAAAAEGGDGGGDATKTPSSSSRSGSGKDSLSSLDAQKLHQRLKESFKEQIGLFREGVYLLTGYKVDMFTDSDRPRFKVRSVYSDREDDHLLFVWPKTKKGEDKLAVTSLDLLGTEMAQILAQSPSFEYMTKYKSMPAFMASVQLSLFEKLTFVG